MGTKGEVGREKLRCSSHRRALVFLEPRPERVPWLTLWFLWETCFVAALEMQMQESDSGDMVRGGPGHTRLPLLCWETLPSPSFPDVSSRENTLFFH